ncbi:cysteine proteinase inhibitor A-like [Aristolochia californica]|uniref:cysteine proteinase inhibitor A-like n=1 Tax=Aristolochia californica TaxID=171875 RepID=UPI0035D642E5
MAVSASFVPALCLLALLLACGASANLGGGRLGGIEEINAVKYNKEVQALGRFCVEEYGKTHNVGGLLSFSEVVKAQQQVVSGMKYYLKISALQGGVPKLFDGVVIVRPWLRSKAKQLVSFTPC